MQVIVHPISAISIVHIPIIPRLQQQQHIPFIIMQHEHIPPCVIMQRFFSISAAVRSSQVQIMRIPPAHFSIFIMQRGTIIPPMDPVAADPIIPGIIDPMGIVPPIMDIGIIIPIAGMPVIIPRSLIIVFIAYSKFCPPTGGRFIWLVSPTWRQLLRVEE